MKRVFQKLNVVKETEDNLKAAKYLAEGYEEITGILQQPEKPVARRGKGNKKAEGAVAGDSDGTCAETEDTAGPDGDGA